MVSPFHVKTAKLKMKVGEINPLDRKFWPKEPEPGFSPERNRLTIDKSIEKYEAMRKKKMDLFTDSLKERTDALASYLAGSEGVQKGRSLERYFGKRYLAHLRGEDITDELRERLKFVGIPTAPKLFGSKGRMLGKSVQEKKTNKNEQ